MDDSAVVVPPYLAPPLRMGEFSALRLAPSRVGDPASARAFARPYSTVNKRLTEWRRRGHIHRDRQPGLYLSEYTVAGLTVRGLVGALDLSRRTSTPEASAVLPHEVVHTKQAVELATRMNQMHLNPAPILLLHRGGGAVTQALAPTLARPADHDFSDRAEQRHRLWAITDPDVLRDVHDHLASARALLADGHHRYAAYLDLQHQHPGTGWDSGLAMLVDQDDTPLHLGAIHRVVPGVTAEQLGRIVVDLGLRATPATRAEAVAQLGRSTPIAGNCDDFRVLDLGVATDDLAVCVLHEKILPALGAAARKITYHHTAQAALEAADDRGGMALLMPSAEFDVVLAKATAGILLPEKATSFQPKPSLGVLMRSLRDT